MQQLSVRKRLTDAEQEKQRRKKSSQVLQEILLSQNSVGKTGNILMSRDKPKDKMPFAYIKPGELPGAYIEADDLPVSSVDRDEDDSNYLGESSSSYDIETVTNEMIQLSNTQLEYDSRL